MTMPCTSPNSDRDRHRLPPWQADAFHQPIGEEGRQHRHLALGEIGDIGNVEHNHDRDADHRIEAAGCEPSDNQIGDHDKEPSAVAHVLITSLSAHRFPPAFTFLAPLAARPAQRPYAAASEGGLAADGEPWIGNSPTSRGSTTAGDDDIVRSKI